MVKYCDMRLLGGNARGIDKAVIGVENGDAQFVWPVAVEDELAKLYHGDDVLYLEVTYRREHSPPSQAGKLLLFRLKYSTKNIVLSPK
ncbi:hypothetical protein DVH24_035571 [Malus domestica]|uniref:Uncharacterized protein n=1 Tax=Malus domestica TaxID=3750 RepID=A0A498J7Z7_MALDO|nr:hypothetical protein DVH24_035571 [Malus domestica]